MITDVMNKRTCMCEDWYALIQGWWQEIQGRESKKRVIQSLIRNFELTGFEFFKSENEFCDSIRFEFELIRTSLQYIYIGLSGKLRAAKDLNLIKLNEIKNLNLLRFNFPSKSARTFRTTQYIIYIKQKISN